MSAPAVAQLNYERRGAGPPLVLLHGIGHRWQAWEPVLDRLAAKHDVIAVDLPGFGKSAPLDGPSGIAEIAAALTAFFGQLGLDRPHVAGNSLGGAIALELAAGGHVSSATALSPAGSGLRGSTGGGSACLLPSVGPPSCPCRCCTPWCGRPGCGYSPSA